MLATRSLRRLLLHRTRTLYTWGTGSDGQLGHGEVTKAGITASYVETAPKLVGSLEHSLIRDASAGHAHTAVVCTDGRVLTCGKPNDHRLGQGSDNTPCGSFEAVHLDVHACSVSCGERHTAVLSEEGELYTWGWGGSYWDGCGALGVGDTNPRSSPTRVVVGDETVKLRSIASGKAHMLGLGYDGEVWSWGSGDSGRCGNGSNADQLEPEPIEYLLDIDAVCTQIDCGSGFSVALTDKGEVYTWGKNEQLQLGLGGGLTMEQYSMEHLPRLVDRLEGEHIVRICAGAAHTIALNNAGEVFVWGQRTWMEPHKISALKGRNIVEVSAGKNFTACISDIGELFVWGKGLMTAQAGVYGQGDKSSRTQPELVPGLGSVKKVRCGEKHVLAILGLPELVTGPSQA